ncbi:MAG: hypothetical protein FJW31_24510 [Acidobacteria bacterium]|nr:hypothetical protein [Acidobacteriota bacterium]
MPASQSAPLDDRHAQILAALHQQFQPQGFVEEFILANLARAAWDEERLRARDCPTGARLAAQYERSFYRALTELRRLQTDRALREPAAAQIIERALQSPRRQHRSTRS